MKKSIFIGLICSIILTSFVSPKPKSVKWLEGTWVGFGYEPNSQDHWLAKMDYTLDNGVFQISYPSFPCAGNWQLLSSDKHQAKFIEYITENTSLCQDEGSLIVTKISDEFISVAYFLPELSDDVIAFAVLRKTP